MSTVVLQIGLVTFSTDVHNQFYLNAHPSKYSVLAALRQVPFQSGATYTGQALQFVRTHSLSTRYGRRANSQPIVIVLTDGQSSDRYNLRWIISVLGLLLQCNRILCVIMLCYRTENNYNNVCYIAHQQQLHELLALYKSTNVIEHTSVC